MPPKFKFLFAPIEGIGHLNACIGIAQQLHSRGHAIVFATPNSWKGKLKSIGFDEEYFQPEEMIESTEKWGEIIAAMAPSLTLPAIQKIDTLNKPLFDECFKKAKESHEGLKRLVQKVKPDVIIVDNVVHVPALMNQGIPWILSYSANPLYTLDAESVPPGCSGLPTFNNDKNAWKKYKNQMLEIYSDLIEDYKTWLINNGGPQIKIKPWTSSIEFSPFANMYMFPAEMSYDIHLPATIDRQTWHRFDAFVREEKGQFEIPDKLLNLPGKLIYFSLGTIGCSELGLMRRLIGILSKSPNRFIVAKGPFGDQLDLPGNMWGATSLPQTLVLPLVDLVITHGGNNTVTESFYFGKPLLVMPLFGDQLDNATRVHETGHGLSLELCDVTEDKLLTSIDTLLSDKILKRRMRSIGVRIRGSNAQSRAADIVEGVARNNV